MRHKSKNKIISNFNNVKEISSEGMVSPGNRDYK